MMLCATVDDDKSNEHYFFPLEIESEGRTTQGTDHNLCYNEGSSLFNEMRKELSNIYSSSSYRHYSKDNESLNNDNKMKDYRRLSAKKSSRRSIWRKYIEIEDMNYLQNKSIRYSMKNGHYSLLRILEAAANESCQKKN